MSELGPGLRASFPVSSYNYIIHNGLGAIPVRGAMTVLNLPSISYPMFLDRNKLGQVKTQAKGSVEIIAAP